MDQPVLEVIGVGFGPSNLALAIALEEVDLIRVDNSQKVRFFERQPRFGWHRGMLLEGATMQVVFLKDLVTMRNPQSNYGFIPYLHEVGRLEDFINSKTLFPYRIEYHDYLEWAAAKLVPIVDYGAEVVSIMPVMIDDDVKYLDVSVRDGGTNSISVWRTRNLVFATGVVPRLPSGINASDRIMHSSTLLQNSYIANARSAKRFVVVGAGQSAAEVTAWLHEEFREAEVCSVFSRYGYSAADNSPFANKIFDPDAIDEFYCSSDEVKRMLLQYHYNTNYSVVDSDLIEELFRRTYLEKITGKQRLRIFHVSQIKQIKENLNAVNIEIELLPTRTTISLEADAVIYATGYNQPNVLQLLDGIAWAAELDESGAPILERDYRVSTHSTVHCGIYVQGGAENIYGISSGLLSNIAVRAGDIASSIMRRLS